MRRRRGTARPISFQFLKSVTQQVKSQGDIQRADNQSGTRDSATKTDTAMLWLHILGALLAFSVGFPATVLWKSHNTRTGIALSVSGILSIALVLLSGSAAANRQGQGISSHGVGGYVTVAILVAWYGLRLHEAYFRARDKTSTIETKRWRTLTIVSLNMAQYLLEGIILPLALFKVAGLGLIHT